VGIGDGDGDGVGVVLALLALALVCVWESKNRHHKRRGYIVVMLKYEKTRGNVPAHCI